MSATEVIVILGCLAAGYFFTSRIVDGRESEPSSSNAESSSEDEYNHAADEADTARAEQPLSARDCYDILGVSAGARADEIRLAYQRKMAQYHPDKVSGLGDKIQATAEAESKRINRAYDYLKSRGYA